MAVINASKLRPLYDRLIVEREEDEGKSTGGILIPDTAKEKPARGRVVAVGEGKYIESSGACRPLAVKAGNTVLFGKYAGTEVKLDGKEYIVMREDDILGIIE